MKAEYILTVYDAQGQRIGSVRAYSAAVLRQFVAGLAPDLRKQVDVFPPAPQEPYTLTWDQFLANERQASPKAQ